MSESAAETNDDSQLFIGLMSGTSADGVDAALVCIDALGITLIAHLETPYSEEQRRQVLELCQPGANEVERMGRLDHQLGKLFARCVNQLLAEQQLKAEQITAIGSHGQTIRHRPPSVSEAPYTLQIADPNLIAELTGITTVADFRRRDIAAGGEGAPLTPAFHDHIFRLQGSDRAIVNIGGISNITVLADNEPCRGYDTGPGNALMDYWVNKHRGENFDRNGQWAASAQADDALLATLLSCEYFQREAPKSTGRELFNAQWLEDILQQGFSDLEPATVQATLLNLTAQSIVTELNKTTATQAYICGGGAYNGELTKKIGELLKRKVSTTGELGIAPEWVEACAFAWLAKQTLGGLAGNKPEVTGASKATILGGIYPA